MRTPTPTIRLWVSLVGAFALECTVGGAAAPATSADEPGAKAPESGQNRNARTGESTFEIPKPLASQQQACSADDARAKAIAAGAFGTCVVIASGSVVCWGHEENTSLCSNNQPTPGSAKHWRVDTQGRRAIQVSVGDEVSCVTTEDGSVGCWGVNALGMLGREALQNIEDDASARSDACYQRVDLGTGLRAKSVHVGTSHVCALLTDGRVKCWGTNEFGQLGQGDQGDEWLVLGNNPGEMGDQLPFVDLGRDIRVEQLSVGGAHSCALLTDGKVKCWGANDTGELGLGDKNSRGDNPGEMGDNLGFVDLGSARSSLGLALGHQHSCALLDDGTIRCWGANLFGSLGIGTKEVIGDEPNELGNSLRPVELDAGGTKVMSVHAGGFVGCSILAGGHLKCWGSNRHGTLGVGDTHNRGERNKEMGAALPFVRLGEFPVVDVAVGHSHLCALSSVGKVKCWGDGNAGVLGYEDERERGARNSDVGEALPVVDWCGSESN